MSKKKLYSSANLKFEKQKEKENYGRQTITYTATYVATYVTIPDIFFNSVAINKPFPSETGTGLDWTYPVVLLPILFPGRFGTAKKE